MQARREKEAVRLTLGGFESYFLKQILSFLRNSYQTKPSELDATISSAWYQMRGSGTMSAEEKADWLNQLHEYKQASLISLNRWIESLSPPASTTPAELILPLGEIPVFVTVINDYRLVSAARHGIGQVEMDVRTLPEFNALPPPQQTALQEISFLAFLIEILLKLLSGELPESSDSDEESTE